MEKKYQINRVPQKKYIIRPITTYLTILNQTGWACFEKATSSSLFKIVLNDIAGNALPKFTAIS